MEFHSVLLLLAAWAQFETFDVMFNGTCSLWRVELQIDLTER